MNRSQQISTSIHELNSRHFQTIRKILTRNCHIFTAFKEATPQQDMEEGFDSVFSFPDVKIPIRIRSNQYLKYRDITIRSRSYHNKKTEIDKIREGKGDYYFYAWENKNNSIACYCIFDIAKFISSGLIDNPTSKKRNNDGTEFYTYSIEDMIKNDTMVIYEQIKTQ